ncbi:MAG TPA: hypothetical protein VFI76_02705, partial [Terrimicrobiaceae bacterium]|nr:hypothetical protein [Terrimicrobiaceae bacterium]
MKATPARGALKAAARAAADEARQSIDTGLKGDRRQSGRQAHDTGLDQRATFTKQSAKKADQFRPHQSIVKRTWVNDNGFIWPAERPDPVSPGSFCYGLTPGNIAGCIAPPLRDQHSKDRGGAEIGAKRSLI